MSIFDGTTEVINRSFFGSRPIDYAHITALRVLADEAIPDLDGAGLVRHLYENIVVRWRAVNGDSPRRASAENWRFTLNTEISERNLSPEKQVEKRVAQLAAKGLLGVNEWANQVPVASGVLDHKADKKACVDLVRQNGPGCFDLIEFKMMEKSGHAVYAAMEILRYGIVYLFSRRRAHELGYEHRKSGLLGASNVKLIVLAPVAYYRRAPIGLLCSLRDTLNLGLAAECAREGPSDLIMELEFEQFPESFEWPCSDDKLLEALRLRSLVIK